MVAWLRFFSPFFFEVPDQRPGRETQRYDPGDTGYVRYQFYYPATYGPKGHGSNGAAAEAAPVLLLQIYPYPVPDGVSVIVGLPYLLLPRDTVCWFRR